MYIWYASDSGCGSYGAMHHTLCLVVCYTFEKQHATRYANVVVVTV
mgnify:CR=1 FL=1|jgi:hypothetical protein